METLKNNQRPKYWRTDKSLKSVNLQIVRWFDRVNGNSYFAAEIIVNDKYRIVLPYQYGYGVQPIHDAAQTLQAYGLVSGDHFGSLASLNKSKFTTSERYGLKRELLAIK